VVRFYRNSKKLIKSISIEKSGADDRNNLEPAIVDQILDEFENWGQYLSGEPEIIHTLRLLEEEAQTGESESVKRRR